MHSIFIRFAAVLFVLFASFYNASATHYLGGEISYWHLGGDTYRIYVRVYRDCDHGEPEAINQDAPFFLGIFTAGGVFVRMEELPGGAIRPMIPSALSGCFNDESHYCINYLEFQKDITLPPGAGGYRLTNSRCCMGDHIQGIYNPVQNGLQLQCIIPGSFMMPDGNAMSFNSLPPARQCVNTPFALDFAITPDPSADKVRYSLADAYRGGSQNDPKPMPGNAQVPLAYLSGFSGQTPLGPAGGVQLDTLTGLLRGRCSAPGQYLISVRAEAWSFGVSLGAVTRTYALTIADCNKQTTARIRVDSLAAGAGTGGTIVRCRGERTIRFDNLSTGAQRYHWDFGVAGSSDDTSGLVNPQFTYPAAGKYPLTLIAFSPACSDTLHTFVVLSDDTATADFISSGSLCANEPIQFTDQSTAGLSVITDRYWNFGNGVAGPTPGSAIWYDGGKKRVRLIVQTSGGCLAGVEKDIDVQAARIGLTGDTTVVTGALLYLTATGSSAYTWLSGTSRFVNFDPQSDRHQVNTSVLSRGMEFVVSGRDASGCLGYGRSRVIVADRGYIFLPSAFTPDGDGVNDRLRMQLAGFNFISFRIFNRAGQVVFDASSSRDSWDGTFRGTEAPFGAYYWVARVRTGSGAEQVFKGDVTLIR